MDLSLITHVPAVPADVERICTIFRDAMRQCITEARGFWDEDKEHAQFLSQLNLNATRMICHQGDPIGFYMLQHAEEEQEQQSEETEAPADVTQSVLVLHTICIQPQSQGAGIGRHVIASLQRLASESNNAIHLSVLKTNASARRLYEKLAFQETGSTQYHWHMEWIP